MTSQPKTRYDYAPRECAQCGQVKIIEGRRLCVVCYTRARRAGTLSAWPMKRGSATYELNMDTPKERARVYRDLTTGPGALSRSRACSVLGITERTAYRYEAWFRSQAENEDQEC